MQLITNATSCSRGCFVSSQWYLFFYLTAVLGLRTGEVHVIAHRQLRRREPPRLVVDQAAPKRANPCYAPFVTSRQSTERQARAEQRRRTWSGGVVKVADMEAVDDQFWAAMSPGQRFVAVWEVSRESYGSEATAGLRGSPHGVRRL